jgi:hypothetical protein
MPLGPSELSLLSVCVFESYFPLWCFLTRVIEIQKRDEISRTEAIAAARREHPRGFNRFQAI